MEKPKAREKSNRDYKTYRHETQLQIQESKIADTNRFKVPNI